MDPTQTDEGGDAQRAWIESRCGVLIPPASVAQLPQRLGSLGSGGGGISASWLESHDSPELRERILDLLTPKQSQWFRDPALWTLLREELLPEWAAALRGDGARRIRIWSAGCAAGQEPYSLALLIDRWCAELGDPEITPARFEIEACDVGASPLFLAMSARYSELLLRGLDEVDPELRARYFTDDGSHHVLDPIIARRVRFERRNVLRGAAAGDAEPFDLIFLRNVLIYLTEETRRRALAAIAGALADNGRLVLGAAETAAGLSDSFATERHDRLAVYRLRPFAAAAPPRGEAAQQGASA